MKKLLIVLLICMVVFQTAACAANRPVTEDTAVSSESTDYAAAESYDAYVEEAPAMAKEEEFFFSDSDARTDSIFDSGSIENGETQTSEEYGEFSESDFLSPEENPLSTFSIDVDTASYANTRRMLLGRLSAESGCGAYRGIYQLLRL